MDQQALELKRIFGGIVDGFGLNHARVYYALLSSEIKTANQLIQETNVNQATTYAVLRDLLKWELIKASNTNPANYYTEDPIRSFEQQVKRKEGTINAKRKQLQDLIAADTDDAEKYLIKIGKGQQTKLVDISTKKEVKYKEDLLKIRNTLDEILKEAPTKEKQMAYNYLR